MTKRRIPGLTLAVARNGAVVKLQGYGFANLEHEVPATPDTVFELASVTKQFTATAIMLLAEEGKLRLDDPITWHILRAPETWKGITVRHLLTHTGGLPGMRDGFKSLQQRWHVNYATPELFESATKDTLIGAPGERWEYSDVGYFLLGMIIESASGQRYGSFLADRFWNPLGMTSTSLLDQWRILKHRAAGYTIRNGELINIRRVSQTDLPSHYGIFSSVKDLATWDAALAGGRVLKPASLAQLWTPARFGNGTHALYGLGWGLDERRGRRVISHTGLTGTEYSRYPDDNLTVIVLTNLGRFVGPGTEAANAWGLTHGVAGRYARELLLSTVTPQADPDPAATQRIADMIAAIARGEETAMLLPALRARSDGAAIKSHVAATTAL
jgi:CubicO group peptidase (beta-lactamase class C family)